MAASLDDVVDSVDKLTKPLGEVVLLMTQLTNMTSLVDRAAKVTKKATDELTAQTEAAKKALNPFQKIAKVLGESDQSSIAGKFHRFGYAFIPFYFKMKNKMEFLARGAGAMWDGLFGKGEDGKPKTGLGAMVQGIKKQMKLLEGVTPNSRFRRKNEDGTTKSMKQQVGDFVSEGNPLYKLLRHPIKNIAKSARFTFKFFNKIHKGFWTLYNTM